MRVALSRVLASREGGTAGFMRYSFRVMLLDQHDSGAAHFLPGAADFCGVAVDKTAGKKIPAIVADGREKGIGGYTEGGKCPLLLLRQLRMHLRRNFIRAQPVLVLEDL